ncbi:BtrH N-terminal domain-containing protein [Polymorphospora sp. NPDC051019]|uniref:BtrH N-terminal domain-containing protein n=1 Tax=Polymorphospora sp. NPDC051019 TaxID=3155725 RepID=UPI00342E79CE
MGNGRAYGRTEHDMTGKKQLKERIRARMAATGERYLTARRHVVTDQPAPTVDRGWTLRGGVHPESANLANVLAHHRVRHDGAPLSEAMLFGIGGGLGAGYILWEFAAHRTCWVTLGFRNRWQYQTWTPDTLARIGIPAEVHRTAGARGAAAALDAALDAGRPAIVLPDRQLVGYWHLPAHHDGHGGHPVVAYARAGGGIRVDDRNLRPLTVDRADLDRARARVVSYKNLLIEARPAAGLELDGATVRGAVVAGLADCAAHLSAPSTSFSLPAWRKWSRLMTDGRNAKGWPKVFADGAGLTGALLSIWEAVSPAGITGGNLRGLYATFLREAAGLLDSPELVEAAEAFDAAAGAWHEVAEAALPASVPAFARMRELTAELGGAVVADGDAGRDTAAAAAAGLAGLSREYAEVPPLDSAGIADLFAATGRALAEAYALEVAAVGKLAAAVAPPPR